MDKITFVTLAAPANDPLQTLLLAQSLRAFGGTLAESPLLFLRPAKSQKLPEDFLESAKAVGAEIFEFSAEDEAYKFPLGLLPFAAAAAEELLADESQLLAWVLPDALFISPPECFLLPEDKLLGYRPVHHANIGAQFGQELDPYWSLVFEHCRVPQEHLFPMTTCTRDKVLYPYFNAGMLVVRPKSGLFSAWKESFRTAYRAKAFKPFLEDVRYAVFLHQAILSGVILHHFSPADLFELPEAVNYPLHLHDEYAPEHRPFSLNELITCRYETIEELLSGKQSVRVEAPLKEWLEEKIG